MGCMRACPHMMCGAKHEKGTPLCVGVNLSYPTLNGPHCSAQVAEEPAHAQLVDQLLVSTHGTALALAHLDVYGFKPGDRAPTFGELAEAARQLGHTALGWRRADGQLTMAPPPESTLEVEEQGSSAIVLVGARGGQRMGHTSGGAGGAPS